MDVSSGESRNYSKFQKEKSKSPFNEESNSRQSPTRGMSVARGSSPDSSYNTSASLLTTNGYCSSPASSASSSASNGKTKNVGVGANLNPKRVQGYNSGSGAKPALSPNSLAGTYPSSEMVAQSRSSSSSAIAVIPRNPSPPGSLPTAGLPLPGQGTLAPSGSGKGSCSSSSEGPSSSGGANPNKMVSQNVNGTLAVTGVPLNESELQLYRVLQRANLLNYYDVMIELGGDDVQQLCDAGEEEFLEIMALVGMASKPLHVRRLQKSLQEWMTQPHLFQMPLISAAHLPGIHPGAAGSGGGREGGVDTQGGLTSPAPSTAPIRPIPYHSLGASPSGVPGLPPGFINPAEIMKNLQSKLSSLRNQSHANPTAIIKHETHGSNSSSPLGHLMGAGSQALIPAVIAANSVSHNGNINGLRGGHSPTGLGHESHHHHSLLHDQRSNYSGRNRSEDSSSPSRSAESPQLDSRTSLSPVPFLQDTEIDRLADAAVNLVANLPANAMEPRLSAKKKMCAEYETVIRIPDNDPGRLDVVRKFAAIYGRQDCKRKVQKPLTLHELTVNEAAAQLCSRLPSLLTRRDELFPLARQVVKDAGLPYGSGIASIISSATHNAMSYKNGRHEDSIKIHLNNNNNINGLMSAVASNGYGKRIKFDSRGAEDLRSPYSHEAESNSEDSHHTNDSFSSSQNRSVITQRQISEDFTSERTSLSHSVNHNGALDMSSGGGNASDEPNDLTISKHFTSSAGSKCHLNNNGSSSSGNTSSAHSIVGRNNIKSEPVS